MILAIYLIGAGIAWICVCMKWINDFGTDADEYFHGTLVGMLVAMIWPVYFIPSIVWLIRKVIKKH